PVHYETSQEFFLALDRNGKLRTKEVEQLYCAHDKMFLADRYVKGRCPVCASADARGDQCEKCGSSLEPLLLKEPRCGICGRVPMVKTTKHWFLPLGEFQPLLEQWLASKPEWKDNVMNYCRGWFKEGLRDRAITRDYDWGVPVPLPGAKGKVLYVWFDAPIGYISSTKEWARNIGQPDRWRDYWCNKDCELIHFIGKDNIVFHAIFWPAMLMGVGGYNLPTQIPANEFLNLEGRKLSTSRNYAVWLPDYLSKWPADLLRYALAANLPEGKDADFSWNEFQRLNNDELADILGNFINRTLTFVTARFGGVIPAPGTLSDADRQMHADLKTGGEEVGALINAFKIRQATARVMDITRTANRYFDAAQPWHTRKTDPARCQATLHVCCQVIRTLAVYFHPFIPFSAERIWNMMKQPGTVAQQSWLTAADPAPLAGVKLDTPEILFRKLEDADLAEEHARLTAVVAEIEAQEKVDRQPSAGASAAAAASEGAARRGQSSAAAAVAPKGSSPDLPASSVKISIDEFAKIDLRVAKVLTAESIPKADKLLRLTLSIGAETRQVVAGIAKHYRPEELAGKTVVLVANLQPAKLRGIESQGMILCADDGGTLSLITVEREAAAGSKVK
ncbi:methionine--tRNA ligase, partial [bacterium]|nr:methionine--tRNA ligase [bacterium]